MCTRVWASFLYVFVFFYSFLDAECEPDRDSMPRRGDDARCATLRGVLKGKEAGMREREAVPPATYVQFHAVLTLWSFGGAAIEKEIEKRSKKYAKKATEK